MTAEHRRAAWWAGRASPVALVAAVIALRLPTLDEPRWYSDEGTFTTVAWLSSQGGRLYQDAFDNSPPGIYAIYRGLLALGGDRHHAVIQGALLVAVLASVLLTFGIATRIDRRAAMPAALLCAIVLSLPVFDGDLLNVEIAALPLFCAALWFALHDRVPLALASGVSLGLALTIRPTYGVDAIAVGAALLLAPRGLRRIALAAAGALAVLVLAVLALAAEGSLSAYLSLVLPDDHAYLLAANGGSLAPLLLRLALAGGVAGVWFARVRTSSWRLLALWLPLSVAGASLTPRGLTHYVIEAVPPLALAVVGAGRRIPGADGARLARRVLAFAGGLAVLVLLAEAVLVVPAREVSLVTGRAAPPPFLHNFSYADLPAYYAQWARSLWAGPSVRRFPGPFATEMAEAGVIDRLPPPQSGPLLVLGDRAWIYVLAHRRAALRYVALNSAFRLIPDGTAEVRAALDDHRAALVVLADAPAGAWIAWLEADGYRRIGADPYPLYAAPGS